MSKHEENYWYSRAGQDRIHSDLQHEAAMNYWYDRKQLGEWQLCPMCHGFGEIRLPETSTPMFGTCPVCNGAKVLARPIINSNNV